MQLKILDTSDYALPGFAGLRYMAPRKTEFWLFLAFFGTFCHFGKILPNPVALFGHINFTDHVSTSLNSFLTVLIRKNVFWLFLAFFGTFWPIFLAHFDPWTICDNSLQQHFLIGSAVQEEIALQTQIASHGDISENISLDKIKL